MNYNELTHDQLVDIAKRQDDRLLNLAEKVSSLEEYAKRVADSEKVKARYPFSEWAFVKLCQRVERLEKSERF